MNKDMKTDNNGCSTCLAGQEQWEDIRLPHNKRIKGVQYDYRHPVTGNLFSCVAINLYVARQKRDEWKEQEDRREHEAESNYFNSHPELNP
jgi:hypothetical protein